MSTSKGWIALVPKQRSGIQVNQAQSLRWKEHHKPIILEHGMLFEDAVTSSPILQVFTADRRQQKLAALEEEGQQIFVICLPTRKPRSKQKFWQ